MKSLREQLGVGLLALLMAGGLLGVSGTFSPDNVSENSNLTATNQTGPVKSDIPVAFPVVQADSDRIPEHEVGNEIFGAPPPSFNFDKVAEMAAELASTAYHEPSSELPPALKDIDYDGYRDIRFRPESSIWRSERLPFELQFFIRGFFFVKKVGVNIIDANGVNPVAFSNSLFHFGKNNITDPLPSDLGFAGIRVHYPLHTWKYFDELVVFLGASYFRALGQHQQYGLSLRGLSIDTGLDKPEEFPLFREFWIVKPGAKATELTIYALLDSPSVAGAYRFVFRPGKNTQVDVKTSLFMRSPVSKLGVAPVTSMHLYGENTERRFDDFRPEIHDSDGLFMQAGHGEYIWRPLSNPKRVRIASFQDTQPKGFGVFQRDRNFDHYEDLEARYERRPSAWIETLSNWGKGAVQLVELPSDSEKYDNIVVFWVPQGERKAGERLDFEYRIHMELDNTERVLLARTTATRAGMGGVVDKLKEHRRKFVLDFEGGPLANLPADTHVEAVVTTNAGKIEEILTQKNEVKGGYRVYFELLPQEKTPTELRCYLRAGNKVLSETWSYLWDPPVL